MPPWSGVGDFSNDWSLSDDQIAMVQQWVDADMPLGDAEGDTALLRWLEPHCLV